MSVAIATDLGAAVDTQAWKVAFDDGDRLVAAAFGMDARRLAGRACTLHQVLPGGHHGARFRTLLPRAESNYFGLV